MRYILGHRSIHIFHRVREIEVHDAHHARAVVLAALAGSPVSGPDDLAGLNADLYRFELDLTDAGDGFQVSHGAWQPVGLEALDRRSLSGLSPPSESPRIALTGCWQLTTRAAPSLPHTNLGTTQHAFADFTPWPAALRPSPSRRQAPGP